MTTTDIVFGTIMPNGTITGLTFIISILCSLAIGVYIAFMYTIKNDYTGSFVMALALIPAIVQVIIMLVNGNIGAGVAVAGAFSLVRFRSAQGNAREIMSINNEVLFDHQTNVAPLGLITMALFRPRSWCVYCPMGMATQLICKVKEAPRQEI